MLRSVGRFGLLGLLGALFVWMSPAEVVASKKYRRCLRKQNRCYRRCARKIRKRTTRCYKREMKRRNRCIKYAYRKGKVCVKKTDCPKADKCYAVCNRRANPGSCYVKKKCAQLRATCQTSCQTPLGFSLRKCLDQTTAAMKSCLAPRKVIKTVCNAQCPKCS